jgi:hypothetical protein
MCSLCRRNLLAGERVRTFRGERMREHAVCALCETDALRRRWLRLDGAATPVRATGLSPTVRRVA